MVELHCGELSHGWADLIQPCWPGFALPAAWPAKPFEQMVLQTWEFYVALHCITAIGSGIKLTSGNQRSTRCSFFSCTLLRIRSCVQVKLTLIYRDNASIPLFAALLP